MAAAVLLVENRPMTKPWMLDELAHAGPEHLDPAFVAGYERKQGFPDPAEDLAVLAAHGLDQTSTVVDLGAGTGRFALAAASRFGRVTAVDVSPAMLAVLRQRAAAAGVANLECVQAGFLSYQSSARGLRPSGRRCIVVVGSALLLDVGRRRFSGAPPPLPAK